MTKKRRFKKVPKSLGVPKKYLSGARNKRSRANEIKRTAERYKKGLPIDIKAVNKARVNSIKKKKRGSKKKT